MESPVFARRTQTAAGTCPNIAFLDLEFSDLSPDKGVIMEVGMIVVNPHLEPLHEYHAVVSHDDAALEHTLSEWARLHHGKCRPGGKSLLQLCAESTTPIEAIGAEMRTIVDRFRPLGRRMMLGGASTHKDREFLTKALPAMEEVVHYRVLDVTTLRELAFRMHGVYPAMEPKNNYSHCAMDDVRASLALMRWYATQCMVFPRAVPTAGLPTWGRAPLYGHYPPPYTYTAPPPFHAGPPPESLPADPRLTPGSLPPFSRALEQVAGNERAIRQVQAYFKDRLSTAPRLPPLLMVTGPSGCGKSLVLQVLAESLGLEVEAVGEEWERPSALKIVPLVSVSKTHDRGFERLRAASAVDTRAGGDLTAKGYFRGRLIRALETSKGAIASLFGDVHRGCMVLADDGYITGADKHVSTIHAMCKEYAAKKRRSAPKTVFVAAFVSDDLRREAVYRLARDSKCVFHVRFGLPADDDVEAELRRVATLAERTFGAPLPSRDAYRAYARSAAGDIHAAVNTLQFYQGGVPGETPPDARPRLLSGGDGGAAGTKPSSSPRSKRAAVKYNPLRGVSVPDAVSLALESRPVFVREPNACVSYSIKYPRFNDTLTHNMYVGMKGTPEHLNGAAQMADHLSWLDMLKSRSGFSSGVSYWSEHALGHHMAIMRKEVDAEMDSDDEVKMHNAYTSLAGVVYNRKVAHAAMLRAREHIMGLIEKAQFIAEIEETDANYLDVLDEHLPAGTHINPGESAFPYAVLEPEEETVVEVRRKTASASAAPMKSNPRSAPGYRDFVVGPVDREAVRVLGRVGQVKPKAKAKGGASKAKGGASKAKGSASKAKGRVKDRESGLGIALTRPKAIDVPARRPVRDVMKERADKTRRRERAKKAATIKGAGSKRRGNIIAAEA